MYRRTGSRLGLIGSGLGSLALVGSGAVHAQSSSGESAARLEEVVVTATRTATPISQIGSSITVVGSEELRLQQQLRVFDIISQIPGVSVAGSESVAPRVNIRGAPFEHTLVLIDGVRMTMPSFRRSESINTLTPDNIERIEVLRGPQSTLYGGDAAGGVINIITRRGEGDPSGSLSLEYGTWNTRKLSAAARGSSGRFDYSLEGGFFNSDWFSVGAPDGEPDARQQETISARLGYEPTDEWRLESILRWVEVRREDDNGVIEVDRHNEDSDYATRLQLTHSPQGGSLESLVAVSLSGNRNQGYQDNQPRNSQRDQKILQFDYQGNVQINSDSTLIFGGEHNRQSVTGGIFEMTNPEDVTNSAGFAQLQGEFRGFFYTLGGRYDRNNSFGGFSTYRLTGAYPLTDSLRLKGNVGTGFRTPNMGQLWGTSPCPHGNPDLGPEENFATEVGLVQQLNRGTRGRGHVEVNYFRNRITNVIVGTHCDGGPPLANNDRRNSRGVEVAVQWTPVPSLDLNVSYSYTDSVDRIGDESFRAHGIPRQTAFFGARYYHDSGLTIGGNVTYNSNRLDPPDIIGPYALVNLTAEYEFSEAWSVYGRINNALDRDYQTNRNAQTADRNMHIGGRLKF